MKKKQADRLEDIKEKNIMSNKTTVTLYYLASLLFYIVAIIKFFNTDFSSGVIWLCLGSAFLCFGGSTQSKHKKSDDKDASDKM